jgi:hypothetical protein
MDGVVKQATRSVCITGHCLDVNQTVLRLMEPCHGNKVKKLREGHSIAFLRKIMFL